MAVERTTTCPTSRRSRSARGRGAATRLVQAACATLRRATIGATTFRSILGRPLARGRHAAGNVISYDRVWRTGANAAPSYDFRAHHARGPGVAGGTYTLWTARTLAAWTDREQQTGQWGNGVQPGSGPGRARSIGQFGHAVEKFTISIEPGDARHGTLAMAWGSFRWRCPSWCRKPFCLARRLTSSERGGDRLGAPPTRRSSAWDWRIPVGRRSCRSRTGSTCRDPPVRIHHTCPRPHASGRSM